MKRNVLRIGGLLFALGIPLLSSALIPHFLIETNAGTTVVFPLQTEPLITYQDNVLHVESTLPGREITMPATDVKRFIFANDDETGILSNRDIEGGAITGLTPGAIVRVYDFAGNLVSTLTADNDGFLNLATDSLTPGLYIIETPAGTFKIKK